MISGSTALLTVHDWHIGVVESLMETVSEVQVRFIGGVQATFSLETPDRQLLLQCLSTSVGYRIPLAFLFDEKEAIVKLAVVSWALIVSVNIQPQYPDYAIVEFGGELLPKYLATQHPRFHDVIRHLSNAMVTNTPLWCIMEGNTIFEILDLPGQVESLTHMMAGESMTA